MTEGRLFDVSGQYRLESDSRCRKPTAFFGQNPSDGRANQRNLRWHRRGNNDLCDRVADESICVGCGSSTTVHVEAVRKGNWRSETGSGTGCGDANCEGDFISTSEHSKFARLDVHHQGTEPLGPLGTRQIFCVEAHHHWRNLHREFADSLGVGWSKGCVSSPHDPGNLTDQIDVYGERLGTSTQPAH